MPHPRILTIDIETAPSIVYSFDRWNVNIGLSQVVEDGRVICFAAKWLDSDEVMFWSEHHDGHEAMVRAAWDLLDQADAVITYNGAKFDVPHLNREFMLAGLGRPAPHKDIDLLKVVKSKSKWESNKLDNIASRLGLGQKIKHEGFELWKLCLAGDSDAWSRMRSYNEQDVVLTEELYRRLLPWITNHPSTGLYTAGERDCPYCGSEDIVRRGFYETKTSRFQRFRCRDCGGWSKEATRVAKVQITAI